MAQEPLEAEESSKAGGNPGNALPGSENAEAGTGSAGSDTPPGSRLWPILILVGFILVILVNAIFIYIAVSGADEVVPSYQTEER